VRQHLGGDQVACLNFEGSLGTVGACAGPQFRTAGILDSEGQASDLPAVEIVK
jgi:hypothetical protein